MAKQEKSTPPAVEPTAEDLLLERETALNQREAELNEREKTLNEREAALETASAPMVPYEQPGESFKFNDIKFQFTPAAPTLIRINGEVKTQKEIIKNKDLLLQLVAGNSSLIKKL